MKSIFVGTVLFLPAILFGSIAMAVEIAVLSSDPDSPTEQVSVAEQGSAAHPSDPLQNYLAKEDSSYRWKKVREGELAGLKYVELILTSQTWREIVWKHRLIILKPENAAPNKHALLVIAGGKWKKRYEDPSDEQGPVKQAVLFASIARQFQSPVAVLMQVPQQPIFDGMVEDEIISYTFDKYLETGDPEWPALLPMVKSAVRGMDAIQEFCRDQWSLSIESFTVTGGSKRGWTTWLVGASDSRVTAIAPMVIDTLNMGAQMDHQQKVWGKFSPQIQDYTQRNIPQRLKTSAGQALLQIVDPLAYREALKLPKLIVLGTNDPYWTLDALNLYWSQLLGPKHILYVPNNGHGLKDFPRVLGSVAALHEQANGGEKLPKPSWSFHEADDQVTITIMSDIRPSKCRVWNASSKTRDFRDSLWTATDATRSGDIYTFQVDVPDTGSKALFGEVQYDRKPLPLYLSTNVRIVSSAELAKQHE